ncbi:Hypothetical protein NTJ_11643 [Nesidiocoris tenuis]|uniref:Uncharacterized protein n=1 Tax=Nesidiocoris tenuis TaxID=355587 RepID=A0ABN7B7T0_9HEMI|nr:Hypothetical protein NTJ_11643 [Nesidiocoris tenuis]
MAARADEEALELIRVLTQIRTIASPEEFGFLCSRLRREMQAYLHARDMRREVSAPPISGTQDAVPLGNTRPPGNPSQRTSLIEWKLELEGDDLLLEGKARDGRRITAGRVMKYIAPNVFTSTGVYAVSSGTTFTTSDAPSPSHTIGERWPGLGDKFMTSQRWWRGRSWRPVPVPTWRTAVQNCRKTNKKRTERWRAPVADRTPSPVRRPPAPPIAPSAPIPSRCAWPKVTAMMNSDFKVMEERIVAEIPT